MAILSGIQPTGRLHLGNYFGCIKSFLKAVKDGIRPDCSILIVADLHCFTKPDVARGTQSNVMHLVRSLLALGIDPDKACIFQQSTIPEHAQLAWYLSCLTRFSRAENMTQFKSLREKFPNVGIFSYPILQAADILLYRPEEVYVGPDQRQHLELVSELCSKANKVANKSIFKLPKAQISNVRIKSLKDGQTKMSKSAPSGCLFLEDEPEIVSGKIRSAKTDDVYGITHCPIKRPALSNLVDIYAGLRSCNFKLIEEEFKGSSHLQFKESLSKEISEYFSNFRQNVISISDATVLEVLECGHVTASKIAKELMTEFQQCFRNKA